MLHLSAPASSRRRMSSIERMPPPTVSGRNTRAAVRDTTSRIVSRFSWLAVMSRKHSSSAPAASYTAACSTGSPASRKRDEVHAFDDATVLDVQTGDNAQLQHCMPFDGTLCDVCARRMQARHRSADATRPCPTTARQPGECPVSRPARPAPRAHRPARHTARGRRSRPRSAPARPCARLLQRGQIGQAADAAGGDHRRGDLAARSTVCSRFSPPSMPSRPISV